MPVDRLMRLVDAVGRLVEGEAAAMKTQGG